MIKNIKERKIGDWEIQYFTVSEEEADMFNLRQLIKKREFAKIKAGNYIRLCEDNSVYMSNTPMEKLTQQEAVKKAKGNVLVAGLGIGLFLEEVLDKKKVKSVTVIELSKDVIELVGYAFDNEKIKIINADIFDWNPEEKYDFAWFDIWPNICMDNLDEMVELEHKYSNNCKEMLFWSRKELEARL